MYFEVGRQRLSVFHTKLKIIQEYADQANEDTLEVEKDEFHNQINQIEQRQHPKRTHTHDDVGKVDEILSEVDNWDLSVHRRETTPDQNRRNVEVGSLDNQPTPRTDKDGFLYHVRLGLVGWISYCCCGNASPTVVILVVLINTMMTFGKVSGSNSCVEKEICDCIEWMRIPQVKSYRNGTRQRIVNDTSQDPVETIVNSSELCVTGFDPREVIPPQFESWFGEGVLQKTGILQFFYRSGKVCTILPGRRGTT
jgi:hypothetical protein